MSVPCRAVPRRYRCRTRPSMPCWAGHSMHWFDMDVAGPELARVLVPSGILAGLWNVMDDRVDWVAGLGRVSGSAAIGARDLLSRWRAETAGVRLPGIGVAARFGSP